MNNIDFESFLNWQKEKVGRNLMIDIGRPSAHEYFQIWVYDYNLGIGQFAQSADEINLEETKINNEKETYIRLKQKFETEGLK